VSSVTELYDPKSPHVLADPYPAYRQMRERAPVGWHDTLEAWMLTRYDDVMRVLKDSRFSSGHGRVEAMFRTFSAEDKARYTVLADTLKSWGFFSDPPCHTRIRSAMNACFTPARMKALRASIEKIAAEFAEKAVGRGEFDLVGEIAAPLPMAVFNRLLDIPPADAPAVQRWSNGIAGFITRIQHSIEAAEAGQTAVEEAMAYFGKALEVRRKNPTDDALSQLATHEFEGKPLSLAEIVSTATMLIFGGHETTTNLLSNAIAAFIAHPGEWDKLRRQPELAAAATEESLRYDGPVQILARIATEDVEMGGETIRAGQRVLILLGAANRDPKHFPDPDRFSLSRANVAKHLGMGNGIHYCSGAPLARLEISIVFNELAKRLPTLRYAGKGLVHHGQITVRGAKSLTLCAR
jgi:cytochrome P450